MGINPNDDMDLHKSDAVAEKNEPETTEKPSGIAGVFVNGVEPAEKQNEEKEKQNEEKEPLENYLESFTKDQLTLLIKKAVAKHPDITEDLHKLADADPAHRKIFVHGLGREAASSETISSVFGKYGEIKDCKALEEPHKKFDVSDLIRMYSETVKARVRVMPVGERVRLPWSRIIRRLEVKILLHTINKGKAKLNGKSYSYGELYTVDTIKGVVSKCGGGRLLDDNGSGSVVVVGGVVYVLGCDPPDGHGDFDDYYNDPENGFTDDDRRKAGIGVVIDHKEEGSVGHIHRRASCLDLRKPDDKWKAAPPPRSLDFKPPCTSLHGKIYSFGGIESFLQIFDPSTNYSGEWDALPRPPQLATNKRLTVSYPVIPDPSNNRIIVHVKEVSSLYAYYPDCQRWDCLVHEKFALWLNTVALVDGVLYFHVPGVPNHPFDAYHLATQKWLKVVFSSEFENHAYVISSEYETLINLGIGNLCLAAFSPDYNLPKTFIFFAQVKVTHTTTEAIVTPICFKQFAIETSCGVTDFLPLQVIREA